MTKGQEKKLKSLLHEIVSLRDGAVCAKCGRQGTLHLSHVKGEGAWPRLRFEPLNVKFLCLHHHLYWWHKDVTEATRWFEETFPSRAEKLNELIRIYYLLPRPDYETLKEKFEEMIYQLKPKNGSTYNMRKVLKEDSRHYE